MCTRIGELAIRHSPGEEFDFVGVVVFSGEPQQTMEFGRVTNSQMIYFTGTLVILHVFYLCRLLMLFIGGVHKNPFAEISHSSCISSCWVDYRLSQLDVQQHGCKVTAITSTYFTAFIQGWAYKLVQQQIAQSSNVSPKLNT